MSLNNLVNFTIPAFSIEGIKTTAITLGSEASKAMTTVGPIAINCFKLYTLYSLYEAALSDLFCLKTFRHGTSPYAALRISWTGPDLLRAGKGGEAAYYQAIGKESPWALRDQNRQAFYVVEDVLSNTYQPNIHNLFLSWTLPKFSAKYYSLRSSAAFFGSFLPLPKTWKAHLITAVIDAAESNGKAAALGALCPTVKFHLHPNSGIRLYEDVGGLAGALYTRHQFSVLDIGILGILKNGIGCDLFQRIRENQGQFLWGIVQLVNAVAFTAFFFPMLIPGGWVVTSGVASIMALKKFGELGSIAGQLILAAPVIYTGLQL